MTARPRQQRDPEGPQLFLRIRHPTMDPRQVTDALAMEPLQTVACGASVEGTVRRLHSESYWIAQLPTTSMQELVEKYRDGVRDLSMLQISKEDVIAHAGGSEWDLRILLQLKGLVAEKPRAFLQQVIREGGSITLLIERGEQRSPFVLKRALPKLAELGIELEVD
jgi:hypothetical protein